jgi:hypothetical protein
MPAYQFIWLAGLGKSQRGGVYSYLLTRTSCPASIALWVRQQDVAMRAKFIGVTVPIRISSVKRNLSPHFRSASTA